MKITETLHWWNEDFKEEWLNKKIIKIKTHSSYIENNYRENKRIAVLEGGEEIILWIDEYCYHPKLRNNKINKATSKFYKKVKKEFINKKLKDLNIDFLNYSRV